ncbi:tetratricopeptide repeat protein [Arcticibacter tournemirensis]|uniref:histidine kinase n=1 Tax=Arcticibacter tournemirensis TaxID=699437 RepID=A0A5M9H4L8_9SPHI|nr:tetratricopeptide repeat protein [Arcticibacter tournemirensis]KAA8481876.1 sensor histidine kinase [Arcticibacter tournemirensis]TQM52206.1 tetratricopeptide repeat protein [Arcticibacter tournemirensis]
MLFYRLILFFTLLTQTLLSYCWRNDQHPERSAKKNFTVSEYEALVKQYRYNKPDSALYYAEKAIALAEREKDSVGLATMLNQLGMIGDNFGKFEESRQNYLRAAAIYRALRSKKGEATETVRLGVVELRKGNYDEAIGYFLKAMELSEQINDRAGIMEANITLGEVYIARKQYDTALRYLKSAEKLDKTLPFSSLSLNLCSNFGIVYREKGDFKLAKAYIQKGINLSNKPQLWGLHITLINNLASVYAKAGFREKSISLQKTALEKSREIQNYIRELQTLTTLADTYGNDNIDYCLFYLKQALALAEEKGAIKQKIDILQRLGDVYKYLKNYKEALKMKEQEHALADSFFYRDMSKQIANLQSEYELNKSKARVQELKYENNRQALERKIILFITAGIAILLLVVAFHYFRTKELNRLLNRANAELKDSNTVKDKLFSILAHDLRQPIASVINFLYIIDDDSLTPDEKHDVINKLIVNSNASLDTLNQLLKWGEMQIKGVVINPVVFCPKEIIERNVNLLSAAADSKSIHIDNTVTDTIRIYCDADHFDFTIRNLLSNAIKFTPNGGRVFITAERKSETTVKFSVKDTGVGISNDRLDSIFKINNISTQGTNNEKGTSLGLAMCKEFIEANNGTIEVVSEKNRGSEFILYIKASSEG